MAKDQVKPHEQGLTEQRIKVLELFERICLRYNPELEFRIAASPQEWEVTKRLRHEIYHQEIHYISEDDLLDEFDALATVYNCYFNGDVIGTLRFIDSAQHLPEMLQTHPDLMKTLPENRHYIEVGRYMILKSYRISKFTLPVFMHIFEHALKQDVEAIILSCAPHLISYYTKFGFQLISDQPIARKYLLNADDYPMIFDFLNDWSWYKELKEFMHRIHRGS